MVSSFRDTLEGEGALHAGWEPSAVLWSDVILGKQREVRHWFAQRSCHSFTVNSTATEFFILLLVFFC